jgi:hypothetical protein
VASWLKVQSVRLFLKGTLPEYYLGQRTSGLLFLCFSSGPSDNLEILWLTRKFPFIFLLNSHSFIRYVFRGYILFVYWERSWYFNNDITRLYYSHVNRLWSPITLKFVKFLILSCLFDFYVFNFLIYLFFSFPYIYIYIYMKTKGEVICEVRLRYLLYNLETKE